jgi:hypothetical protein
MKMKRKMKAMMVNKSKVQVQGSQVLVRLERGRRHAQDNERNHQLVVVQGVRREPDLS